MESLKNFFKGAGLVAASTLGAGIFALPYIFKEAGLVVGIFYLIILSLLIITAHVLYFKVLVAVHEKERILGLAKDYLGNLGYYFGLISIVFGLILTLVVYLIIGSQFLRTLTPLGAQAGLLVFWAASSLPLFFRERGTAAIQLLGVTLTAAIIFLIFFASFPNAASFKLEPINFKNFFLPFGAVLFSLAGWTSIERVYNLKGNFGPGMLRAETAIGAGTVFAAVLCLIFVFGIFGSAQITPDTISGVAGWPFWEKISLAILGLVAVWTSYLSISIEIKNSFEHDIRWPPGISRAVVVLAPLVLIFLGFNNFLRVLGLVGGVFLSFQYLIIVLVGRSVLRPRGVKSIFLNLLALIFILAAVYEVYYFVVG